MNPESASTPAEELQAEIARLREKLSNVKDTDMYEALEWKIGRLVEQLAALSQPEPEPEPETTSAPPTPQQLQAADGLVRQARVEKMRGNAKGSTDFLRQAASVAPTSPTVLEALADDLLDQRQRSEALMVYKRAVKLDPKNVGLERKYAMLVLGSTPTLSFEDAMRADWSESPFLSTNDHVASPLAASFLTVLLPGAGHLVLGKTSTGFMILGGWGACCLWLAFMAKDFAALAAKVSGKNAGHANMVVLVPLIILAIIYIGAINSLRVPKKVAGRGKIDRPRPPVNLPFD